MIYQFACVKELLKKFYRDCLKQNGNVNSSAGRWVGSNRGTSGLDVQDLSWNVVVSNGEPSFCV